MIFPMSDNWWVEEDKAFFCGTRISALFRVDMNSLQCEVIAWLPENDKIDFFVHPYCLKHKNFIVCLPGTGKEIWYYDIEQAVWKKTEIDNDGQFIISVKSYNQTGGRIWLLEYDKGKILQFNLDKKIVEKEYYLPCDNHEVYFGEYVVVHNKLYTTVENRVYCIDAKSENVIVYEVPEIRAGLYTICYDGINFWLGGYCKEIYIWNPQQGLIKILTEFPERFGIYHFPGVPNIDYNTFTREVEEGPFFQYSICLGQYVWYFPAQSNGVVYIDRETYEIHFLEIKEEQETMESLKRDYANKFLFEYIREDRYIGIYSILNKKVFEIDTVALCVKYRQYELDSKTVLKLGEDLDKYDGTRLFRENKENDRFFFKVSLKENNEVNSNTIHNIGENIYHMLNK